MVQSIEKRVSGASVITITLAIAGLLAIADAQYRVLPEVDHEEANVTHSLQVLRELSDTLWIAAQLDIRSVQDGSQGSRSDQEGLARLIERLGEQRRTLRELMSADEMHRTALDNVILDIDGVLSDARGRASGAGDAGEPTRRAGLELERILTKRTSMILGGEAMARLEQTRLTKARSLSERAHNRARLLLVWGLSLIGAAVVTGALWHYLERARRSRAKRDLLAERRLFDTLLAHVPIGIYICQLDGRFSRVSAGMARLLGLAQAEQMEGKRIDQVIPDLPEDTLSKMESATRSGQGALAEERQMSLPSGGTEWVYHSMQVIPGDDDRPGMVLGVVERITEQREAAQAREESAKRVSEWAAQLEEHNARERLLGELGELLQTCSSEEEAGAVLVRYMPALYPGMAGHLAITKASRNLVEPVATWGGRQALPFAPSQCWALRRGRRHRAGGGRLEPSCDVGCGACGEHSYCLPMMAHGESTGVFHLTGPRELDKGEEALAGVVAERVGLALANLRLRDALRVLSIRDALTGLFNRRYLEEAGERELRRATRHTRNLTFVMADVDHFKRLNDTFGHDAGDTVLRELGRVLCEELRKEDIACRYGGEEFLLLMPEVGAAGGREMAERLRQIVARLDVSSDGHPIGTITLSLGVASYPEHGQTFEQLMKAADQALYQAKQNGRNQVHLASTPTPVKPALQTTK